jgi:phosphonate transport system permease protein
MFETIEMALWGTLLALFAAVPLAFFGARGYTPNKVTYLLARMLTSGTRAIPEMISALVLVMIFGFGAIPGVMALAISTSGFLGKFLAEDIENADPGPQEALRCLGANKLKVLRYAVFPQVMPQYVAYMQYMFERNVRAATAIGIVGAGGIGMELKGRWDMFDYAHFSTVMIVMLVTVLALERLSQLVRSRLIA